MMKYAAAYLAALVALAILDGLWLGLIARDFYKGRIGQLLLEQPVWPVAALFYLVHAAGIVMFPVTMAEGSGPWTTALIYGALFGFFAYAVYDLTNLATLRGWSPAVTLVDLAWGTAATALAAVAAHYGKNSV